MASYNIQSSLRPKARPTKEQDNKPAVGIGSRDKPEEKEEKSFLDTVSDWFAGAGANLTPEEQARENGATLYTLPEFDDATRRSAEESALYRMDMGITSSLVEGGDEALREKLPDGTTYSPPKRPGLTFEEAEDALIIIPEPEPVTVESLDGGGGLMSPTGGETATDTTDNIFATLVTTTGSETVDSTTPLTAGFDSLVEAEGTDIHLDGRGFVTLPYGIVPDSGSVKKANGTTFDPTGSHGLSASQLSGVDYSGATKFGLSRTDYDNDEAFAKAVYAEFANRTATSYGEGFEDLTDEAKQAAYDMAWNAGIGSAGWSSVQTMLNEASKDGDRSKDSLIGFTTNFRSGSDYPRGLLKRRLQTYNLVANEGEAASVITTTAVMKDGKRTGTLYTVKDANGGVLKTWTKPDLDEVLGDLEVPQ